jgi:hypothetical protein
VKPLTFDAPAGSREWKNTSSASVSPSTNTLSKQVRGQLTIIRRNHARMPHSEAIVCFLLWLAGALDRQHAHASRCNRDTGKSKLWVSGALMAVDMASSITNRCWLPRKDLQTSHLRTAESGRGIEDSNLIDMS